MARRGVNKVILIGNVGGDPELRAIPNGTSVANFTMATNESWTDSSGTKQERTEWHRIVVWRRLAEICNQYLRKGSKVYIEGSLQTRSWEGQDGQKRYTTEVVARDMQMLDSRNDVSSGMESYPTEGNTQPGGSPGMQSQNVQQASSSGSSPEAPPYSPEDDLPF